MVLTKDTRDEIEEFFSLFRNYVDDVTVTQYTERGGNLEKIPNKEKNKIDELIKKNVLSNDTNFFVEANGDLNVSVGRKPCYQLFQRLMITFDGRVAMCCHDWGAQHCLGFIDKKNIPIQEIFLSVDTIMDIRTTRSIKRGTLEDSNFKPNRIFNIHEVLPILKSLDPVTQKAVFPEPRWFLEKNYYLTRVGLAEVKGGDEESEDLIFGIEYDTDYYTGVLFIPIPVGLANNIMSQIDRSDNFLESLAEPQSGFEVNP